MKTPKEHIPFYIITGGPGVGKTTLLNELRNRGIATVPEIARELIKEQQEIDGEALPWKNKKRYMEMMFHRSVKSFKKTIKGYSGTQPVFFDRGFLDALCYASLEGIPIDKEMKTTSETLRYNSNVFILPPWKDIYQTDAQRKQDWNEAVFTYNKMIQTYRGYQYDLVEVPRLTVNERADFIVSFLKRT
ncbi:AAA family ATPase [Flagellimonas baculiformis]|uniref:AAA family ATPase n=1 Tax=Flagellimonas baculiformis TaxID=3067310 RepID=UPI00296F23DB|nr:AAA family ATPase [Muricauda sp. D6]